jgi:hypothetical protein
MARTTRELRQRRHRRLRKVLSGTPERPRVAVSRTNKHISAQIIDDVNGRTLAAASSVEGVLKDATGGNCWPAARRKPISPRWSLTAVASTTTAEWRRSPTPFVPVDWSFND